AISQRTISRTLCKANLFARVAYSKPFINTNAKEEHEKFFTLISPNPHQYIWRLPEEEFDDNCLVPAIKSKEIIVWRYFSWWGLGPLVRVYSSITSASYHRMLSCYAISKLQDQYSNSNRVFQHDGTSVHRSKIVKRYLVNKNIEPLKWPLYSPDLSQIENLWFEVEKKLRKCRSRPGNLNGLERMVKEEWEALSQYYYKHLVESEVDCVIEVYNNDSG
ncbi:14362_t:CDS:2, partial [Racocetra persica]